MTKADITLKRKREALEYERMQKSPIYFAERMWGVTPQPLLREFEKRFEFGQYFEQEEWQTFIDSVRPSWFGMFERGKNITWQQTLILLCLEKAVSGKASKKISIVSGRGIGKSSVLAIIILWFLFCHPRALVPCTAVTASQLNDALWKELAMWLEKMKPEYKEKFEWSSSFVRMKELPAEWYARAKTASKDRPEALSGVHSEWIMGIVDEASAVAEEVFEMGEGIFSSEQAYMIMISNGTRSDGKFYRSHHENKADYQTLSFSSDDSPVVDKAMIRSVVSEYCREILPKDYHTVTEYRVNIMGKFPIEGVMDDKGYIPLLGERDVRMEHIEDDGEKTFVGHRIMGVDCAGEGDDKTVWVIRDRIRGNIVHEESISTPEGIAMKTVTLAERYGIRYEDYGDIIIDGFGVGHNVAQEIAVITKGKGRVHPVNTGDKCTEEAEREVYANQRAEAYWKLRQWLQTGGVIDTHNGLKKDLLAMKYKHIGARTQIEPKIDMKKRGVKSPDFADALSMTFLRTIRGPMSEAERRNSEENVRDFDPGLCVEL